MNLKKTRLLRSLSFSLATCLGVTSLATAQIGTTDCNSNINSTGFEAILAGNGSDSITVDAFSLIAGPTPAGEPGKYAWATTNITPIPRSAGLYCLGAGATYLNPAVYTGNRNVSNAMYLDVTPSAHGYAAGSTYYFQLVYRDAAASACTSQGLCYNTSSSLAITFAP